MVWGITWLLLIKKAKWNFRGEADSDPFELRSFYIMNFPINLATFFAFLALRNKQLEHWLWHTWMRSSISAINSFFILIGFNNFFIIIIWSFNFHSVWWCCVSVFGMTIWSFLDIDWKIIRFEVFINLIKEIIVIDNLSSTFTSILVISIHRFRRLLEVLMCSKLKIL